MHTRDSNNVYLNIGGERRHSMNI